jgi:hypothetical protein
MVKNVTSVLYYSKRVSFSGNEERVEVILKEKCCTLVVIN